MGLFVFLVCLFSVMLSVFVLAQNPRAMSYWLFAMMSIFLCLWNVANYVIDYIVTNVYIGGLINKAAYISSCFAIVSGLLFTYFFPIQRKVRRTEKFIIIALTVSVACFSATSLVAGSVSVNNVGDLSFSAGKLLWLFVLGCVTMLVIGVRNLLALTLKMSKDLKAQANIVLMAFCVCVVSGLVFNGLLPLISGNWQTTKLGPLFGTILLEIMIVYAITRRGLFDIKLAAVRTATYILSLLTLSIAYYGLAYGVSAILFHGQTSASMSISPVNIILALFLAFIFQLVKRFFDKITNRFFYKDNYNSDDFFARLNRTLTSTNDLRGLLERAANEIASTLKSEQAFFFIDTSGDRYITAGTEHYSKMPKGDALELQIVNEMDYGLFIASLRKDDDPIRRLMISHKIELILPLKQANLVGYLCLGQHRTSHYTNRDIKVLNTITDELVIAIQNAMAIQEVRELNATLQQRINNATKELRNSNALLRRLDKVKDEFVSIASHQLRTPLTSVKGYISMVLDGDAGAVSDSQRHLLDEAFMSSERMVHLINDFLNVSRLQTGKFMLDKHPVDLSKIVEQEIDSLRPNALAHSLEYVYHPPKNFPILDIDEGKIRQVVMNFADNSLYYSHENTKIHVNLSVEGDEVLFTVKDNGIGVPADERTQLFTKFYRASNAKKQRPDGTGVGLFLAKKVIDAHGGQVVFESVEGKGSTFGFRLPIKSLISAPVSDANNLDN